MAVVVVEQEEEEVEEDRPSFVVDRKRHSAAVGASHAAVAAPQPYPEYPAAERESAYAEKMSK